VEIVGAGILLTVIVVASTWFWGHLAGRAREEQGGQYREGFRWGAIGGMWGLWKAQTPPATPPPLPRPRTAADGPMRCSACGTLLVSGTVHTCG
jgi:hypothetical protein